jgi:hypothetical protein
VVRLDPGVQMLYGTRRERIVSVVDEQGVLEAWDHVIWLEKIGDPQWMSRFDAPRSRSWSLEWSDVGAAEMV